MSRFRDSFRRRSTIRGVARPSLAASAACVCLFGAAQQGCNIAAPIAYVLEGPPKNEAHYTLNPDRPTVIFIDDRDNRLPKRSLRDVIGLEADQTLIEHKAVLQNKMIASKSALQIVAGERLGATKSIAEIGRAVGAEVVVYVRMESWTLSQNGQAYEPYVSATVKVIDAVANERMWPDEGAGFPLIVRPPHPHADLPTKPGERVAAENALGKSVGIALARLFFTYERDSASDHRNN